MSATGMYLNDTIEAIIKELSDELNQMHDTCNWTKETEFREKQINERIAALLELRVIYDDFVTAQVEPKEKEDLFAVMGNIFRP